MALSTCTCGSASHRFLAVDKHGVRVRNYLVSNQSDWRLSDGLFSGKALPFFGVGRGKSLRTCRSSRWFGLRAEADRAREKPLGNGVSRDKVTVNVLESEEKESVNMRSLNERTDSSNEGKTSSSDSVDLDPASLENLDLFLAKVKEQKFKEDALLASPDSILDTLILISPFFLWGTAMVAMKGVLPKAGPMFVASWRLIPAGILLILYGASRGKRQPSGALAWISIALFGLVDASCFQGFLAEGLKRTSAGLGSVIIDSQPLTVAILAALLFGESLEFVNYAGLALGITGLVLLEVPVDSLQRLLSSAAGGGGVVEGLTGLSSLSEFTSLDRGEWRMLLAAQSMALGTVMVRWVCQYSDPFMATGWHMVLGGIPLLVLSFLQQDPAVTGHIQDLDASDWLALLYTSLGEARSAMGFSSTMPLEGV